MHAALPTTRRRHRNDDLRLGRRELLTMAEARRLLLRQRIRGLIEGHDVAGAVLLLHHTITTLVLLMPGRTLAEPAAGERTSVRLFLDLGGDRALAAVYLVLASVVGFAVLRLSLSQRVTETCLLLVLVASVALAVVYLTGNPASTSAWDAVIRALVAWWAYLALDRE